MKKTLLPLLLVATTVVGVMGYLVIGKNDTKSSSTVSNTPTTASATAFKKACDIFSQTDANAILGGDTIKADTSSNDVVTAQTAVTTCGYTLKAGSANNKIATVLVRASGINEAETAFNGAKMNDAQDVNSLGVKAYWSPTYGQLNLLKNGNWVIISVGGTLSSSRTSIESESTAKLIVSRL